jgi:molybdopterin converting factor small subunit
MQGRHEWYSRDVTTVTETIVVRLFAGLEAKTAQGRARYGVTPTQAPTVGALQALLGLAEGATGIVLVNGLHARVGQELAPGDEVSLFPPLGGG